MLFICNVFYQFSGDNDDVGQGVELEGRCGEDVDQGKDGAYNFFTDEGGYD